MVLNTIHLNQRLSVDDQIKEIERIQEASAGEVLFTTSTGANTDLIDTLLYKSGVQYQVGVANYTAQYYKV